MLFRGAEDVEYSPAAPGRDRLSSRLHQQFIPQFGCANCLAISRLQGFDIWTENPRVGGWIPPLATITISHGSSSLKLVGALFHHWPFTTRWAGLNRT
jgi:hypothetical protein